MTVRAYDWDGIHRATGNPGDAAYADRLMAAVKTNPGMVTDQPVPGVAELEKRIAALEAGSGSVDDGSVSILDFGGGPDKTPAQNVAALHDALAAADTVRFPPGFHSFDAPIDARGLIGKTLIGAGQWHTGLRMTVDAPWLLDFGGAYLCHLRDMTVTHEGLFAGTLLKLGEDGEAKDCTVTRCSVRGPYSGDYSATGISLNESHGHKIRDTLIANCRYGVTGMKTGGFSNAQLIDGCKLYKNKDAHITNGGSGWTVSSTIIEQAEEDGAVRTDRAFRFADLDLGYRMPMGMRFDGLWHGDVNQGTGFEIAGYGWEFSGHLSVWQPVGHQHTTIKAIGPVEGLNCAGAVFNGNRSTAIDLGDRLVSKFVPGAFEQLTNPIIGVER